MRQNYSWSARLIVLNVSQRPSGVESDRIKFVSIATVVRFSREFQGISLCDLLQNRHVVLPVIKAVNFPDGFSSDSRRRVSERRLNQFLYPGPRSGVFMPGKKFNDHAQS